jgi:hypothetical protein
MYGFLVLDESRKKGPWNELKGDHLKEIKVNKGNYKNQI